MKRRLNPVVVGAFVLGGLALAAAALLSFGARHLFSEPYRFVVLIDNNSVSGLDVGSAVKLSGVRIGRVESVTAHFNREIDKIAVRVECDFYEDAARALLDDKTKSPAELMRELILGGLHAKLNFSGITGILYMDLEIDNPAETGPTEVAYENSTGYPIVPMAPSLLAEFTDAFSAIASGLAQVDYPGLSTELHTVLQNLNRSLAGLDLGQTAGRVEAAAGAVQNLAENPELRAAFSSLDDNLHQLRTLLATWNRASPDLRDNLTKAIDAATHALAGVERLTGSGAALLEERRELPDDLASTLASLQRAADAVERLADYLERNPGALLRGRESSGPKKD